MNPPTPTDENDILARVSLLLGWGVLLSALVLLIGGSVYLVRHGAEEMPSRRQFTPQPEEYSHPWSILAGASQGRGRSIIQLGLLVLLATPVLRVAYTVLAFARRRDWIYVLLSLLVLTVLSIGFFAPIGR